jgi:hypothetical protein
MPVAHRPNSVGRPSLVAPLRRLYFDDKVVGLGLEGGGCARGAATQGGAVVWLGRRQLSLRARSGEQRDEAARREWSGRESPRCEACSG